MPAAGMQGSEMASDELFVVAGLPPGVQQVMGPANIQRLREAHPRVRLEVVSEPEHFLALTPRADGIVIFPAFTALPSSLFQAGTRLRWLHSVSAGVNRLMTPALLAAREIPLTSSKGPMGPMMAEHVMMMMLALIKDLPGFLQDQQERRWRALGDARQTYDLFGRTVAILGVGAVGGHLARICKIGFGMRVLGLSRTRRGDPNVDRYFERAELHAVLAESDVVVLTLALTPETANIIDAAALAAMPSHALLINVARGGLIDQAALIQALQTGSIAGAGLDTTEPEPLEPDSPLWPMPNVIVTPHVSIGRDRAAGRVIDFVIENVRSFAEGEPLQGLVDRDAGY